MSKGGKGIAGTAAGLRARSGGLMDGRWDVLMHPLGVSASSRITEMMLSGLPLGAREAAGYFRNKFNIHVWEDAGGRCPAPPFSWKEKETPWGVSLVVSFVCNGLDRAGLERVMLGSLEQSMYFFGIGQNHHLKYGPNAVSRLYALVPSFRTDVLCRNEVDEAVRRVAERAICPVPLEFTTWRPGRR